MQWPTNYYHLKTKRVSHFNYPTFYSTHKNKTVLRYYLSTEFSIAYLKRAKLRPCMRPPPPPQIFRQSGSLNEY